MRHLLVPCIAALSPLAFSTLLGFNLITPKALAQSIIPADDGTDTVVSPTDSSYAITGGTLSGDGANLFHSFDQFGLTETEAANFIADPAIQNILGRIIGGDASIIDGLLQVSDSSANLYLINPAGILFGDNATLNLDGSFTATTASGIEFGENWLQSIGNSDYASLVGNPTAFGFTTDAMGALVNTGQLTVDPGAILTLIGGSVVNTGTLSAPGGQIIVMAVPGENLVRLQTEGALLSLELETLPETAGLLLPFSSLDIPALLQAGGSEMATSITVNDDGTVSLTGAETSLPTSQGTTLVSGSLDVTGETGGTTHILGEQIGVVSGTIDASGSLSGGTVLVGGDYQGGESIPRAQLTLVDTDSVLRADTLEIGNGGEVIVWADKFTQFDGSISAQGGLLSGDGGFVEVSGRDTLAFNGFVDVGAVNGTWGTLLLDPTDITIDNNLSTPGVEASLPDIFAAETPGAVTLNADTLQNQTGNVVLEATNNITIADGVALVFVPGGSITFTADADNDNVGNFVMENPADTIEALGRSLTITGASVIAGNIDVGDSTVAQAGNVDITASTGAITVGNITTTANADFNGDNGFQNAGSVNLSAENGRIIAEDINTFASITGLPSGTGGAVTISAGGAIDIASVEASSGGGGGSPINITTTNGDITTGRLSASGQNQGGGNDITLSTVSGSIVTGDIFARTVQDQGDVFNAGNIDIEATNGSITTGILDAQSAGPTAVGNGGNITLNSDVGILITGDILANSNTQGGNVELVSNSGITINGIDTLTLSAAGNNQDGIINFNSPFVTLTGDEINLLSPIIGTGSLFLQPTTIEQEIVLGGLNDLGNTVLDLLSDDLTALQDGFNSITIGRTNGTGTISLGGDVVFTDPVTLQTLGTIDTSNSTFTGVDNASLSLQAGTGINTGSIVTNGETVSIDGDTDQNGDGSVTVNSAITTAGGNITLNGASSTGVGLSIPAAGSLDSVGGDIELTGSSTGPDNLARGIEISGTINSQGGNISATGNSADREGIVNFAPITSEGGNIVLNGTSDGTGTFARGIALVDSVDSGDGNINFIGSGANAGISTFESATVTAGAGNISFTNDNPLLQTNVSGSGSLEIQPLSPDLDITLGGVDDPAVTFLNQSELNQLGVDFSSITIGQADDTGSITLESFTINSPLAIGGGSELINLNQDATWTLTGSNAGSLEGFGSPLNFMNIEAISGGTGSNTINLADGISLALSVNGGTGPLTLQGNQITLNTDIRTDGALTVVASDGDILTREITTSGGEINLTASQGAIATQNLTTSGGPIILDAESSITAGALDSSGATGGAVTLQANDFIEIDSINTEGDIAGGSINITADTFQASGSFTNQAGMEASLSTLSLLGSDGLSNPDEGGSISISYKSPAFIVGDPSINGTLAAITTDDVALLPAPNNPILGSQIFGDSLPGEVQFLGTAISENEPPPDVDPDVDINALDNGADNDSSETSTANETTVDVIEQDLLDTEFEQKQEQLEKGINTEFTNFFGGSIKEAQSVSLAEAKETLNSIQKQTGEVPAFMYVGFSTTVNDSPILELMLITASGDPHLVQVPSASRQEMIKTQEQLRRHITNPNLINNTGYLEPAQKLYDWIIAPIQPYLEEAGVTNLGLIMDAGLRTLPLAVLHDGENFLIEKYSLGLMPSIGYIDTNYVNLNSQTSSLLVGGASQFINQPPLLAANIEMAAIQKLWPSSRRLTETNFTVDAVRQGRRQSKIIHLATHAEFLRGAPDNSYLQFFDRQLRLNEVSQLGWYDPPVELVILSACQTAIGNAEAELGFAGFFLKAGAKSALASLWKVSDEATAGLMLTFYQQLDQEAIKAEALRRAQLAMIRGEIYTENDQLVSTARTETLPPELHWDGKQDFSHPFFWSAFTLVGSPW